MCILDTSSATTHNTYLTWSDAMSSCLDNGQYPLTPKRASMLTIDLSGPDIWTGSIWSMSVFSVSYNRSIEGN